MKNLIKNPDSLTEALAVSWKLLSMGVTEAKDPFHTPVLGTVDAAGCSLRTVVLRRVMEPERILICHTDLRSAKVQHIRAHPRVNWHFYHPQHNVQLRLAGPATMHTDDALADEQWGNSKLMSRRCYRAVPGPGTPSDGPTSGLPEFLETRSPTLEESEVGRQHFVVIACRVDFLDWYYLRAQGHRRAQFFWDDEGVSSQWVVP